MSTEEWGVGYDEGYQQGWNDAMDEKHVPELEELSLENIRLQNLVKDLSDWNDKLRERLSYREAYPANFIGDWEGLTEDERTYFWNHAGTVGWWEILKMVEAKLKEKNT